MKPTAPPLPTGDPDALERATRDEATAALAHQALGDHFLEQGDTNLALAHYEQSLAWDFRSPRARTLAAELRARLSPVADSAHPTLTLPPDRLGPAAVRYRLLREIGRGGAGAVYLAEDVRLGRRVALKLLHPPRSGENDKAERALDEARIAAGLSHPGVIRIFDLDVARRLIVMEHLSGGSLRDRLLPGDPLPVSAVIGLGRALCEILQAIHARGILHGDLKPANVLFRAGRAGGLGDPVLADFGLARTQLVAATAGPGAGTLTYMAPEQRRGTAQSVRTDLYALGVILFEAHAGRLPHSRQVLLSSVLPPSPQVPPGTPPPFESLLCDLLSARPEGRPADAGEARRRLDAVAEALKGTGDPEG